MAGKERYKREDADYKEIVEEWGAPIAVVYSYIEAQDTEKRLNRRKLLKTFLSVALLLLTATLAIYTYFLNKSYQAVRDTIPNEIKETLIIEE